MPHSPRRLPLLVALAAFLAVTRAALLVLPYQSVRGWLRSWAGVLAACARRDLPAQHQAGCVTFMNRLLFGPDTPLTEGLVAEALLLELGHEATLRIGVARPAGGGIDAHAWVEINREVMTGKLDDLGRYVPLESGALQRGLATWMARPGRPFQVRKTS